MRATSIRGKRGKMEKQFEYQLLFDHINRLTERRQNVTTIHLSVNAAIIGAMSFIIKDITTLQWQLKISLIVLLSAGIISCDLWRRLIYQYRTLLAWWYGQLRQYENDNNDVLKVITNEYNDLYCDKGQKPRLGITKYEIGLAGLFMSLYILFGIAILLSIFFS